VSTDNTDRTTPQAPIASDDVASWHLQPDGSWERHLFDAEGNRLEDIQDSLMARARSRVKGRH